MKVIQTILPILVLVSYSLSYDKSYIDNIVNDILIKKEVSINKNLKNPFFNPVKLKKSKPSIKKNPIAVTPLPKVTGILNKKALINSSLYKIGDSVDGYIIRTITNNKVTFLKDGTLYANTFIQNKILFKRDH